MTRVLFLLFTLLVMTDFSMNAQSTDNSNRGPSETKRYWYTTEERVINGKTYIIKDKYTVREVALHTDREYIEKETNQLVETVKKDGYKLFPTKEYVYKMPNKELLTSQEYFSFGEPYFCPDSASIKKLNTDGSYDQTSINYIINAKISTIPAPKKPEPTPKTYGKEILDNWLDYIE